MLRSLTTSEILLEQGVCYIPLSIPHSTLVSFALPFAIFPVKEIERQDDWINFAFSVTRMSMHYPEVTLVKRRGGGGVQSVPKYRY